MSIVSYKSIIKFLNWIYVMQGSEFLAILAFIFLFIMGMKPLFFEIAVSLPFFVSWLMVLTFLLLGGGWTVKSSGWEQVPFTPQGNLPARGTKSIYIYFSRLKWP